MSTAIPRYVKNIEKEVSLKLRSIKKTESELLESRHMYFDSVLEIYQEGLSKLIHNTKTFAMFLTEVRNAYDNALHVRDERISQFIIQDRVFGISAHKKEIDNKVVNLLKEIDELKDQNLKLTFQLYRTKKEIGKMKDSEFSEYLTLMRERDARYTLYFENLALHMKLKELDGSAQSRDEERADPAVLRIALERCRAQLSVTQTELKKMSDEYADTVPRREYDTLEAKYFDVSKNLNNVNKELQAAQDNMKRLSALKAYTEEELVETKELCAELERAGTPRPQWELCADFISGGRDRWRQLAKGLSSRDALRVLLKELGPAAESDHLEYFEGLGTDPAVPPYLRHEGRVRNLRLSRREVSVLINDIWLGKLQHEDMSMQDYVTRYFEHRYQQPSIRAEWAYNLCAGAEQMLDEPQVKLFWGVLHGQLSEHVWRGLRENWQRLREQLRAHAGHHETITTDDFEKVARTAFPLKSEVDIKNLMDAVRKQLKLKLNCYEICLEKLFHENEEGFERSELARELLRQRQAAQARYLREVLAVAAGRRAFAATAAANVLLSVDGLKRAFAVVDPAIDHIRMNRYIRWAYSDQTSDLNTVAPLPLKTIAMRLAGGDIERVGPRYRGTRRTLYK